MITTAQKLDEYYERLLHWRRGCQAHPQDPEPQPEHFGLRNETEVFCARLKRKQAMALPLEKGTK